MDLGEFVSLGFLQELNRQFLHPHGLAFSLDVGPQEGFAAVWDQRESPEGIIFDGPSLEKAQSVERFESDRRNERVKRLGYWIQPVVGLRSEVPSPYAKALSRILADAMRRGDIDEAEIAWIVQGFHDSQPRSAP